MAETNRQTLASYEAHAQDYIAGTPRIVSGPVKLWIDAALEGLDREASILELGSAFGRDAAYIKNLGYKIECTDATQAFLEHLRAHGFTARYFNILTGRLPAIHDLILANAVLLHFTGDEVSAILRKMAEGLKPGGRFAFSLKQGEGEEWSNAKLNAPRYFRYWRPAELPALLRQAGFTGWHIETAATDRKHAGWIYAIAHMGA
ncbi:class I SAM-dependent DNA methyltransferase [Acidocella sp.]|uniref:class I SAM-dependent DNA methyltransferase n=1 Tax=Acidocella sp. TaxID=50710 RepID=UPI003D062757